VARKFSFSLPTDCFVVFPSHGAYVMIFGFFNQIKIIQRLEFLFSLFAGDQQLLMYLSCVYAVLASSFEDLDH
jgi:hypothetical protein